MLVAVLLVGGAIGAPARYLLDGAVQDRVEGTFPWGTFAVNVTGSLVLGIVTGLALYHGLGDVPRAAVGTGFCGAYTTFSTFSYDAMTLIEDGDYRRAAIYISASVLVSLIATFLGIAAAEQLLAARRSM